MPTRHLIRNLALSCHPIPTVAVTGLSAGLAALAGDRIALAALLVLTVFTGQLSIGWSNDWIDAGRDAALHRSDKPLAVPDAGLRRTVGVASGCALVGTVAGSVALGHRAGLAAFVIVAGGWAYNLGLKATVWSWVPYALAFGALPAAATLAADPSRWPAGWAMAAGALLGVAAHLANVLPDLRDDVALGVIGFPHRLGARRTAVVGPLLLVLATALISRPALLLAVPVATVAILLGASRPAGRGYFLATVAVAVLDLVVFARSGGRLT